VIRFLVFELKHLSNLDNVCVGQAFHTLAVPILLCSVLRNSNE
jgi:hypothetical protein